MATKSYGGVKIPTPTKLRGEGRSPIQPSHGDFGSGPAAGSPKSSDKRAGGKGKK